MRKRILAGLVGAALAALTTTWLIAQPVTQSVITGQECWSVGQGPGGPSTFLCINPVTARNPDVVLSAVTGSFTIGAASANVTVSGTPGMTALASGGNLLVNAQPAAATMTMPPNPIPDGAVVNVCNVTAAAWITNVVTLAANSGQTLAQAATLTTLAAGTCAEEQWNLSQATWYRLR